MTRVRWTANAANDLASIVNYIRKDNPEAPGVLPRSFSTACRNCERFRAAAGLVSSTTHGSWFSLHGLTLPFMKSSKTKFRCFAFVMLPETGLKRFRPSPAPQGGALKATKA
jgi:hypothetical protein